MIRYFTLLVILVSLGLFIGVPVFAQQAGQPGGNSGFNSGFDEVKKIGKSADNKINDFDGKPADFIMKVLKTVLQLLAVIAVAVLIYGGFVYVTSAGNDDKAEKGKKVILYAIIGLLIIGVSAIVVNVVIGTFRKP